MTEMLTEPVRHPSAWYGKDLAADGSWIVHLTPRHLEEIAAAVASVKARGLPFAALDKSDFPLPTLAPQLRTWIKDVTTGRGFVVVRGLNVPDYSDEDVGTIFWGMGLHLGKAVTQNPRGDLLGHVFDHGRKYGELDVRGYETSAHLPFHTDSGDTVGLLCLRRAQSGGLSSVVSAVAIHNEILKRHPEYLAPLYRGFHYIRREAALTDSPVTPHRVPVFGARDGVVSVRLVRNQINAACVKTGVPLAPLEKAALDLFDELAQEPGHPSRHGSGGRATSSSATTTSACTRAPATSTSPRSSAAATWCGCGSPWITAGRWPTDLRRTAATAPRTRSNLPCSPPAERFQRGRERR